MKTALTIAGFALAVTGLTGCGGEDGAPTDASVEEFCGNFESFGEDVSEAGLDDDAAVMEIVRDFVDQMVETGTPEDIPDDAREGFELTTDAIQDLDDDASSDDFLSLDEDFSESEQEKADAFDDYLEETCGE